MDSTNWSKILPTVLLGMRASLRDDTTSRIAKATYGYPLRLPGEFLEPRPATTDGQMNLQELQANLASLRPAEFRNSTRKTFVHQELKNSMHVFIREDMAKRPLTSLYSGPYKVLDRQDKFFVVQLPGREATISLDRMKPAFLPSEDEQQPQESSKLRCTPDITEQQTTNSPTDINQQEPYKTRSGRRVKRRVLLSVKPKHLKVSRHRSTTPINTILMFVPQQEAWIVERMGKFHRILEPGLNVLLPIIDSVKYVQNLKEMAIDIPKQSAITADNVTLNIDGVLYLQILDAYCASYGVEDPEFAITQLAQTTMRSELGKITLDNVFRERENLNVNIVASINKASEAWGITCLRYEIRDIKLPQRVQEAMQMQVEAERKKRATILESEGVREADINVAEGQRASKILASEAEKQQQINKANGEAEALLVLAEARARGLNIVASALSTKDGRDAASLHIAEQYIESFSKLARTNNTMILSNEVNNVPSLVSQAMAIYNTVSNNQSQPNSLSDSTEKKNQKKNPEYFSDDECDVK